MNGLSLLAVLCLGQAQGADLGQDSRLAVPVSARLKIVSLPDTLKVLEAATGVPLKAAPPIADLKCIVLVEAKPASTVMEKLADTLRCTWTKDDKGYVLSMPPAEAVKEREYVETADRVRRERAESQAKAFAWAAGIPLNDRKTTMENLQREIQNLARDPAKRAEMVQTQDRYMALGQSGVARQYVAGHLYRSLDAAGWARFWQGQPLIGTVADTPGAAAVMKSNRFPPPEEEDRDHHYVILKYSPVSAQVSVFDLDFDADTGKGKGAGRSSSAYTSGQEAVILSRLSLVRDSAQWGILPKGDSALDAPIEPKVAGKESRYVSGFYSDADHLEWLFDQSKIPIVGTGFRLANRSSNLERPGPLRGYLTKFAADTTGYVRFADGFVQFRRGAFPTLRRLEVPETVLKPLDEKPSLTLNDYAAFVQKLTPLQGETLQVDHTYLTEFSLRPLRDALPALQFYAALNASQRSTVVNGRRLQVGSLGGPQQRLFLETMWSGLFNYSNLDLPLFQAIVRGDPAPLAPFAFFLETKGLMFSRAAKPMPLDWFDTNSHYTSDGFTNERLPGIRFRFADPAGRGLAFETTLAK